MLFQQEVSHFRQNVQLCDFQMLHLTNLSEGFNGINATSAIAKLDRFALLQISTIPVVKVFDDSHQRSCLTNAYKVKSGPVFIHIISVYACTQPQGNIDKTSHCHLLITGSIISLIYCSQTVKLIPLKLIQKILKALMMLFYRKL